MKNGSGRNCCLFQGYKINSLFPLNNGSKWEWRVAACCSQVVMALRGWRSLPAWHHLWETAGRRRRGRNDAGLCWCVSPLKGFLWYLSEAQVVIGGPGTSTIWVPKWAVRWLVCMWLHLWFVFSQGPKPDQLLLFQSLFWPGWNQLLM